MKTRTQNHGGADEEDEVAENDTTTIGRVHRGRRPYTVRGSETEMDSDTDDEMDGTMGLRPPPNRAKTVKTTTFWTKRMWRPRRLAVMANDDAWTLVIKDLIL